MPVTNRIYDPSAPAGDLPQLARRALDGLKGKTIGFIDNAKPNFDYFIDDLSAVLTARYGVTHVVKRAKRGPSMPATGEVLEELASQCDLVITGSGD